MDPYPSGCKNSRPFPAVEMVAAILLTFLISGCASQRFARPREGTTQRGMASWYGPKFHGKPTANGEIYDMDGLTAAHRELPLGTMIEVTHLENGRRVQVRINDRGPFVRGRILDLSRGAARQLKMIEEGVAPVEIRVLTVGSGRPGALYTAAYTVQVGAFRDRKNAERVLSQVRRNHPDALIVHEGGVHRVRVGRFERRPDAEATRKTLRKRGFDAILVPIPRR